MFFKVLKTLTENNPAPRYRLLDAFLDKINKTCDEGSFRFLITCNGTEEFFSFSSFIKFLETNNLAYQNPFRPSNNKSMFLSYLAGRELRLDEYPDYYSPRDPEKYLSDLTGDILTSTIMADGKKWQINSTEFCDKTRDLEYADLINRKWMRDAFLLATEEVKKGNIWFWSRWKDFMLKHVREDWVCAIFPDYLSSKWANSSPENNMLYLIHTMLHSQADGQFSLNDTIYHLEKIALSGNTTALMELSVLHENRTHNLLQAAIYCRRAARAGNPEGMRKYATWLSSNKKNAKKIDGFTLFNYAWLPEEMFVVLEMNTQTAFREKLIRSYLARLLIYCDTPQTKYEYALMLYNERGGPQDTAAAIKYLHEAAESGYSEAYPMLASVYRYKNIPLAIHWTDRVATNKQFDSNLRNDADETLEFLFEWMLKPENHEDLIALLVNDAVFNNRSNFGYAILHWFWEPAIQNKLLAWFRENDAPEILRCALSKTHMLGIVKDEIKPEIRRLLDKAIWKQETAIAALAISGQEIAPKLNVRTSALIVGFFSGNNVKDKWKTRLEENRGKIFSLGNCAVQ